MPGEFDLIRRCFTRATSHTDLGVGDDAALLQVVPGNQLVVSTDMLVSGTHFFADVPPAALGWKTAAVNISDIAAMGAQPRWITLALAVPEVDETWLGSFADGFAACCSSFGLDWIGGDTTRGPLNLCATVMGELPRGEAVLRSGARPGDDIWVSGMPGLAALGLRALRGTTQLPGDWHEACLAALYCPQPRVELGLALRGVASAMLDVSDGLLGDLGHILELSGCGAMLDEAALPLAGPLAACKDSSLARDVVLRGGDDYELLFTAAETQRGMIEALSAQLDLPLARIGVTTTAAQLLLKTRDGQTEALAAKGFDHFS